MLSCFPRCTDVLHEVGGGRFTLGIDADELCESCIHREYLAVSRDTRDDTTVDRYRQLVAVLLLDQPGSDLFGQGGGRAG